MSVTNGQVADQNTFNGAFVSRTTDSSATGKIDLQNVDTTSLVDVQRVINEIADQSGIANQAATDANAKIYSSTNVVVDGEDLKVSIGKLDATFDIATGHDHDGVNSKALSAGDLADINNFFAEFQENTFDAAVGLSIDVSTDFVAETPGGDASTEGVITTVPNNLLTIAEKTTGGEIEDGSGNRVFGRLTEAAGVWTVSFFVNLVGVETAYSLPSQDIKYLYRKVFNQSNRPTIGANVAAYDTVNAVNDIPDATVSQAGKVSVGAQTFGGVKEFDSRPTTSGVDIVDISASQVITNKDIDGATASNTNRITLPKDNTTNLTALTRKEGTVFYDTDEQNFFGDNGTDIIPLGGGGSGGGGLDTFYTENFEETDAASFSSGNNAAFDGGGTIDGTLADDEVSPINGLRSITYTMGASSTDDYFYPLAVALNEKQQGQFFSATLYAKYDGDADDIKALIWDDTNDTELVSVSINSPDSNRYTMTGFVPSTCSSIKMGFQTVTGNNTKILEFDDFEMTLNPFVLATADNANSMVRVAGRAGFGSSANKITYFTTEIDNFGSDILFDNSSTNGASFTVQTDGIYSFTLVDTAGSANSFVGISLNASSLTTGINSLAVAEQLAVGNHTISNVLVEVSWSGQLYAGDIVRPQSQGSGGGPNTGLVTMTAAKQGRQQVTVVESASASNSMVRVGTANGHGSSGTKIRRWSNVISDIGSDVTYTDNATNGSLFTINSDGVYNISLSETAGSGTSHVGVSLNSSSLSTNIGSLAEAERLMIFEVPDSNGNASSSWTGQLSAGDEIRPHSQGNAGGTAAWASMTVTKIGTTQITGVPLPKVAYLKDIKPSGVVGGTFTASGSYVTRTLNTMEGDSDFLTLSSNQFTLPKGKYIITATATAAAVNNHKAKIRNITDSTDEIIGGNFQTTTGTFVHAPAIVEGSFEISSSKTFELQHRCSSTNSGDGFGNAAGFGDDEVYSIVKITKVK